eukprot:15454046-Alexandrium_andersonii.AAC.1
MLLIPEGPEPERAPVSLGRPWKRSRNALTKTKSHCPEVASSKGALPTPPADRPWGAGPLPWLTMSTSVMHQPRARRCRQP